MNQYWRQNNNSSLTQTTVDASLASAKTIEESKEAIKRWLPDEMPERFNNGSRTENTKEKSRKDE